MYLIIGSNWSNTFLPISLLQNYMPLTSISTIQYYHDMIALDGADAVETTTMWQQPCMEHAIIKTVKLYSSRL